MATATHPPRRANLSAGGPESATLRGFFGVFRYSRRALELGMEHQPPPDHRRSRC